MTSNRINNTIFFDLGNVLLFFSLEKMFHQLSECTKIPAHILREGHFHNNHLLQKYETGHLSSEEFYRFLQSKTSHSFSFSEMMFAMSDIFTPNRELWAIVEKLKSQGDRLVLISNINECHFNFAFSHYPILKLFDSFILSFEVKACKPEARIFEKAMLESQGKNFYTDDIPAFVEAGRAAGLDAEIFTNVPTLVTQLQSRQLLLSEE